MVNIQDCGCPCEDNAKKKQIEERALSSINKVYTTEGATYFPDGTGMVTLPLPTAEQIQQIGENSERLTIDEETLRQLKISDAENVEAIAQAQRDISAHAEEIGDIKATDTQQDAKIKTAEGEIDALKTLTDSITKSLITDVEVRDGAGSGTFLVELTEEDGTKRTSDTYQYGQVGSFELIQGTEAGYVRGRLTLTNGVVKESNDYQILQLVESDVYVTAITLTPDYTAGKLGGEIGYSNGNKAQIDPVLVPTAPGVTSNIDALLKRMTSAETVDKEQTAKIANLETRVKAIEDTPGVGQFAAGKLGTIKGGTADGSVQAQEDGTGTVVGWSGKADTADVAKKADKTALDATDAKVTQIQTAVGDCFNAAEITSDGKLQLTAVDGQVNELTLPASDDPTDLRMISDVIAIAPVSVAGASAAYSTKIQDQYANFDSVTSLPTALLKTFQVGSTTTDTSYHSPLVIDDTGTAAAKSFGAKLKAKIEKFYPNATFSINFYIYTYNQNRKPIIVETGITYYKDYVSEAYVERWNFPATIKIPDYLTSTRPIKIMPGYISIRIR